MLTTEGDSPVKVMFNNFLEYSGTREILLEYRGTTL